MFLGMPVNISVVSDTIRSLCTQEKGALETCGILEEGYPHSSGIRLSLGRAGR